MFVRYDRRRRRRRRCVEDTYLERLHHDDGLEER